MKSLDENTLRAIVDLQGNPNWEKIFSWIKASRDFAIKALNENTVFNSGRVAEIQDIIDKVETAREKYDQLQVQKNLGIK